MRVALYVPCFNGAGWLVDCLTALLAQTRPADEIAVVDDGSTDESASLVRRFNGRVRLVSHEQNRGLAVARNTALREIECDVLASVDADVRACPSWLSELLAGFDSPRTVAVGGKLIEAHQERLADRWRAAHMAQHAGDFPRRNPPVLPGANVAVRRDIVRALGGYDETFRTNYEDADLQHRLIERGYHCNYVPHAEAFHLRTDTARTVLRTYWGWLRPPAERAGAFRSPGSLSERRNSVWQLARQAMWQDLSGGAPELSYLSLLVGTVFPLADALFASGRAAECGEHANARALLGWGAERWRQLCSDSSEIGRAVAADIRAVHWWPIERFSMEPLDISTASVRPPTLPEAWHAALLASRNRLAAEEGWDASGRQRRKDGESETLAVVEYGPAHARRQLTVTIASPPAGSDLRDVIAAHRIGWLRPSVFQQSLLCTGRTTWGDPAPLAAVPAWHPEQIEPGDALDEIGEAELALAARSPQDAMGHAVAALLVARRSYTAFADEQHAALTRAWPEAPRPADTEPAEFVAAASRLLDRWFCLRDGRSNGARLHRRVRALRGRMRGLSVA